MEYKDADRSNIGRENTGKTWNQQCSAEKYHPYSNIVLYSLPTCKKGFLQDF